MASLAPRRRSAFITHSRRGPLWLLAGLLGALLLAALATPLARAVLHPWPSGASGVDIDSSGARVVVTGQHFEVALPLAVINHTDHVISGVSLWVEAYACPPGARPGQGCPRVLSAAQEVPMHLAPGGSGTWSSSFPGAIPDGLQGARIVVVRRLAGVEDEVDAARARALAGF